MKSKKANRQRVTILEEKKGTVLFIALLIIAALLLFGSALLIMNTAELRAVGAERNAKQALYIAEAGIERTLYTLKQDTDWSDETPLSNLYTDEELTYQAGDRAYVGRYTVVLNNRSINDVVITSTGEVDNTRRKIRVRVSR